MNTQQSCLRSLFNKCLHISTEYVGDLHSFMARSIADLDPADHLNHLTLRYDAEFDWVFRILVKKIPKNRHYSLYDQKYTKAIGLITAITVYASSFEDVSSLFGFESAVDKMPFYLDKNT